MARIVEEVVVPKVWTAEEAYRSGKTAYRIGVETNGNPFTKDPLLSEQWIKGHNVASANDLFKKRTDHATPEDRYERRPKSRTGTNVWRPGRTPKEDLRNNRN